VRRKRSKPLNPRTLVGGGSVIEGRLLALILAMLAIGVVLEHSGAVRLSESLVAPQLKGLPPVVIV